MGWEAHFPAELAIPPCLEASCAGKGLLAASLRTGRGLRVILTLLKQQRRQQGSLLELQTAELGVGRLLWSSRGTKSC